MKDHTSCYTPDRQWIWPPHSLSRGIGRGTKKILIHMHCLISANMFQVDSGPNRPLGELSSQTAAGQVKDLGLRWWPLDGIAGRFF